MFHLYCLHRTLQNFPWAMLLFFNSIFRPSSTNVSKRLFISWPCAHIPYPPSISLMLCWSFISTCITRVSKYVETSPPNYDIFGRYPPEWDFYASGVGGGVYGCCCRQFSLVLKGWQVTWKERTNISASWNYISLVMFCRRMKTKETKENLCWFVLMIQQIKFD